MKQSYIALTIGPIYKTLSNAKKPKELFSSSYIFSYIMKNIILEFKDRKFIIPYVDEKAFNENKVGLFHDRFIFKSQNGDLEKLQKVIDEVLKNVSQNLDISFEAVKDYLQINYIQKELEENKNPILKLTPYLDTKELFFQVSQNNDFVSKLRRKKGDKDNFLTLDKNIIDDLKKLSSNNYYCVVHADGDKMGEVIKDIENISNISKNLFEYCKNSYQLIQDFGGQTIFAGGDDLLFFAPVVGKDKSTIFNLCEKISQDFENRFKIATLSFGISINFIKFPLYEAVENSRFQLFAKAKNENRNNIAFQVTKHSGQSFDAVIHKGNEKIYKEFLKFVKIISNEKDDTNFLHSIHHKIDSYKTILETIKNDKAKLENFFDNYFNKNEHNEYREFFDSLIDFIYISQDLNMVYSTLRFIKFVKGDKK